MFITFEGIEGCGKTTQWAKLAERLVLEGYNIVQTREPGGTLIGNAIRNILLDQQFNRMNSLCELFLYQAARAQHLHEVILPALQQGKTVLCDRFIDSTYAYQGGGRGKNAELLAQLDTWTTDGLEPDLTFLIDLDVEDGLRRSKKRLSEQGLLKSEGRFEMEDLQFHQMVRMAFLERAKNLPHRIHVIDGRSSIDKTFEMIWKLCQTKLNSQK